MAALSPTFVGPDDVSVPSPPVAARSRSAVRAGVASALAPSVTLPLRFVLTGVVALVVGLGLLVVRPDVLAGYHYNQYVVAATHLFVLGFVCSIVMGAMYQLVPVALETRLHSERMARWQFAFHLVGWTGMVAMFWVWNLKQVGHFGSVLAVGVGLFVYNIARTLRRGPRGNVVATGIASALTWLSLGVLAGLAVAAGKCTYGSASTLTPTNPLWALVATLRGTAGFVTRFDAIGVMHAHAHLGVVGFFLMMIIAVSYKLVPMFLLSDIQNERRARSSIWVLNVALAGLGVTIVLRSPWKLLFALLAAGAVGLYAFEIAAIVRARKRRVIDWGLRHFLTAVGVLLAVSVLGVVLAWPGLPLTEFTAQLEGVYGFVGILGVVAFTILGFLYKIVPFIVWYHRYSREVGRRKVPSLSDLYSERLQILGYWLFLVGLLTTTVGIGSQSEPIVRAGAIVLLLGLAVFAANLSRMLGHFFSPPLSLSPAPAKPGRPEGQ